MSGFLSIIPASEKHSIPEVTVKVDDQGLIDLCQSNYGSHQQDLIILSRKQARSLIAALTLAAYRKRAAE